MDDFTSGFMAILFIIVIGLVVVLIAKDSKDDRKFKPCTEFTNSTIDYVPARCLNHFINSTSTAYEKN